MNLFKQETHRNSWELFHIITEKIDYSFRKK